MRFSPNLFELHFFSNPHKLLKSTIQYTPLRLSKNKTKIKTKTKTQKQVFYICHFSLRLSKNKTKIKTKTTTQKQVLYIHKNRFSNKFDVRFIVETSNATFNDSCLKGS